MSRFKDLDRQNEEFNNFMHKVTEVGNIIEKLSSKDEKEQAIGDAEAKIYLGEQGTLKEETINVENVKLKIKTNRTLINKNALQEESLDQPTMSQDAFKREIERDANKRYQDRKVRQEKMETLKKQATLAFNRSEYEKALSCYNRALDLVRDNHNLYLSRGLTYIKLKFYEKALSDIDRALYLNENSLKGLLLKAKIHFLTEEKEKMQIIIVESKKKHPKLADFIDEYIQELENQNENRQN